MTNKLTFFWLAIVTENELGLAFPLGTFPKKFCPDPSTFYLVIVVTNRQTDRQTERQTNAGDSIIPRESFRGDNNWFIKELNIFSYIIRMPRNHVLDKGADPHSGSGTFERRQALIPLNNGCFSATNTTHGFIQPWCSLKPPLLWPLVVYAEHELPQICLKYSFR